MTSVSSPPVRPGQAALCRVRVHHKRFAPTEHTLAYRVNYLLVDVDALPVLDRQLPGFGYNRNRAFGVFDADYGPAADGQRTIREWLDGAFSAAGFDTNGRHYHLLTQPRLLGRAFNPISVVYAYDAQDQLDGVLYEVHNTFGERHGYLHSVTLQGRSLRVHTSRKALYVSPFFDMEGEYRFAASAPGERLALGITYRAAATPGAQPTVRLTARMTGELQPLSGRTLAWTLFINPLGGLKVIGAIHFEAIKLWAKRVPLTLASKPPRAS